MVQKITIEDVSVRKFKLSDRLAAAMDQEIANKIADRLRSLFVVQDVHVCSDGFKITLVEGFQDWNTVESLLIAAVSWNLGIGERLEIEHKPLTRNATSQ